jgi:hypothetical protein
LGKLGVNSITEYQMLRVEQARHESQIFEMFKFALTGAVAILAFGLQQRATGNLNAWAIVATTPLIVIPAGIFSMAKAQMEMRIGAYIQAYFEERDPELGWDQALAALSKVNNKPDLWLKIAIFAGYATVGAAGLAVAWIISPAEGIAYPIMWGESGAIALVALFALIALTRSDRNGFASTDLVAFRDLKALTTDERDDRYHCDDWPREVPTAERAGK